MQTNRMAAQTHEHTLTMLGLLKKNTRAYTNAARL